MVKFRKVLSIASIEVPQPITSAYTKVSARWVGYDEVPFVYVMWFAVLGNKVGQSVE